VKQKTHQIGGLKRIGKRAGRGAANLFLPRALFVAVRLQALSALVLVHLQPAFLLQIAHMVRPKVRPAPGAVKLELG
jgi:hypothetical protein